MVTAVVESPLRQRQRLRSPLSSSGSGGGGGDFEFRHWRPVKRVTGMRRRWAPPEIEIPNGSNGLSGCGGGGRGSYTSLRDIMSSPEYAAKSSSPDEAGSGDVHMIRHPLVKHAAYAYLQLTPSAVEERARLMRRRRGSLCRLIMGCLGFVGALFGR
ncbi:hypothetical protein HU200_054470 [Digitaria exilis]|uniref:Uncharacterized protein n=1 Tax=Digitaria exilis TaxID=1010633 RepID=A0A835E7M6_9POAL|nr:hypothetical protein HU200_054470 [Digitaria exilis]